MAGVRMTHDAAKTGPLRWLWRHLTRLEQTVVVLLAVFAVRFLFSAAAQKLAFLRVPDAIGSGRHPVDVWLLLLSCTAVLGTVCLYRRVWRVTGGLDRFQAGATALCSVGSAAFYLYAMAGRQTLYVMDQAVFYNLQVRLESNFAESVFMGVGATVYKTWFNDYIPLVINVLSEPFFMFTDRTANTYATLEAMLFPPLVWLGAALLLAALARHYAPRAPRLFFAAGMAMTVFFPLLHTDLYIGMPDMLGVGFMLVLLALGLDYDFSAPAPSRLVCMTVFTGMVMLTRRCYMSGAACYFLLYGLWALVRALRRRDRGALRRLLTFAGVSVLTVGGALAPMLWRMAAFNYAERYSTYLNGGMPAELRGQAGSLGTIWLVLGAAGILFAVTRKNDASGRFFGLLGPAGALMTIFLLTRVQNLSSHQSLAMAAYYLLTVYLFAAGAASLPQAALRRGLLTALLALGLYNGTLMLGLLQPWPTAALYPRGRLSAPAGRADMEQVFAVDDWLVENAPGWRSAYMICHGGVYSPEVFRESRMPDETIRDILPYGACNPGNDAFPTEVFTAQVVLSCEPFDECNHTGKIDAVFRENLKTFGAFAEAARFDMGNGYTVVAWRRVKPATRAEVETYRAALTEEDEQWPYNFSAVFDDFLAENGL